MTSHLRRLFGVLSLVFLFATACSSSDGTDVAVDATDTEQTDTTDTTDNGDDAGGAESDSIPVPDDGSAETAIAGLDATEPEVADADPAENTVQFVRNQFNIDPTPEAVTCIVDRGADDDVLELALRTPSVSQGNVDDTQLGSLTDAVNSCLDPISLGDWAIEAVGPQGDVRETGPTCFAEVFDDGDTGDAVFNNFVALTFQFRINQDAVPDLINTLTDCAPINGLSEFFAGSEEQSNGFTIAIDRDCLNETLSERSVSEDFWTGFVDGGTPPVTLIQPFLDACNAEPEAAPVFENASIPADFVPWAGTGALASVQPAARANAYSSPPPLTIDPSTSYEAVFATGGGEIRIDLFADTAPITVNNFVNLARDGYYDGTVFHRVLEQFMAQGGDPTGTGTGGPGYSFGDEFDGGEAFDRTGLLAMANSGPATNGSQFFITTVETDWLTGAHTIFGEVTEGYDLVEAIQLRDPGAASSRGQSIDSITIIEG